MTAGRSPFPFDWDAWRRFYRQLAAVQGPSAWREAAFRGALALASGAAWVREPDAPPPDRTVLVVGHQRSGTTWLHRMLASHPAASALPLHALLLPADGWQRTFQRPRPEWLDRLQDRAFGPLDPLHRIRLHEPEEDEFLLWGLFRSPMCSLDRPWPPGLTPSIDHDRTALAFYAQAVARSVRRTGRRHVGKNPHFTHRIADLRPLLPGLRVVRLLRSPLEAIPSRMSLVRAIWRRRFPGFTELRPHQVEAIYQSSLRCYRGAQDADVVVPYRALVRDPVGVVTTLHEALDLEPPDDRWLGRLRQTRRAGRTPHRYSLEAFGLSPERVRGDLGPTFDLLERLEAPERSPA